MIFFIEGLSKSGKSTLCKLYCQKYNGIYFKGSGQVMMGIDDKWDDYNFYMHNIIERLDNLNSSIFNKLPILWDRGLSESVYGDEKWARLLKVHSEMFVFFIDVPFKVLKSRNSLEGTEISSNYKKYKTVLSRFEHEYISPKKHQDYFITDEILETLNEKITCKLKTV